jgi:PAS domain S-box-containing protein
VENLVSAFEQLGEFLDQLSAGVQFIDEDFRYRYLNRAASLHGRQPREELLGRTMQDCYPGIERTEMFARLQRVLHTGKADALENAFNFPDGSLGWFELQVYRVRGGLAITSVDITRRKRLETSLNHAQRMEAAAQLAGGVAHEFNNLLLIVRSFSELVRQDHGLSESNKRGVGEILQAVDRASSLTTKLLTFSRHTGGRHQRFDVNEHLTQFCSTLSAALGEGIRLTTELAPAAGIIRIDPQAWEHTLTSLSLNAREALAGRGKITLRTRRVLVGSEAPLDAKQQPLAAGDYVGILVSDEGPGIPDNVIDKIFDPFFSTKKTGGGTGLGLSTCWGIVQHAGGTIHVQSKEGQGTQFEIFLPRKASLSSDSIVPARSFAPPSSRGRRNVLIVDDEPAIVASLVDLLELSGHQATGAANAHAALEAMESDQFELVISDILMPGMSGVALAEEMERRGWEIPVLLMSGYSPDHDSLKGAQRFPMMTKPFKLNELLVAIERLLSSGAP